MIPEEIIRSLAQTTPSKIVLLVLDGIGGLPREGRTELEAAHTPSLDKLASCSELGLTDPVGRGITPGSGPSHLALFGYDPLRYEIGRGVLEALGVGLEMTDRDVAGRGNFATMEHGHITDRRAGRIATEKNKELCCLLAKSIPRVQDAEVIIDPGMEHRFTVMFRADGLDDRLADADPQKAPAEPLPAHALAPEAERTAGIVNEYIRRANEVLRDQHPANTILLRGFARFPHIPSMSDLFKLQPAAIAAYPMYRGLARLVGMDVLDTGPTFADEIATLKRHWDNFDFFFLHYKDTDKAGEDGDFDAKVAALERFDARLPDVLALGPDVLAVSGDHSTPSILAAHGWQPVPALVSSAYCGADHVSRFTERDCAGGALGILPAQDLMPILMANALRLAKYGA